MTLRIYDGHAFFIKDIEDFAKIYACADCRARLKKACHLQGHDKTRSQGRTIIECRLCRPLALSPQVMSPQPKLRRPSIEVVSPQLVSPHRSQVTQTVYCEFHFIPVRTIVQTRSIRLTSGFFAIVEIKHAKDEA